MMPRHYFATPRYVILPYGDMRGSHTQKAAASAFFFAAMSRQAFACGAILLAATDVSPQFVLPISPLFR